MAADDRGRVQLICIRPAGPFVAFDERLTAIATRYVRHVRVRIFRPWDCAAVHDLGFVSPRLPTVITVRDGEIIAKAIGDLGRRELEDLVFRAAPQAEARQAA